MLTFQSFLDAYSRKEVYFSDPRLNGLLTRSALVAFDMNGLIIEDEGLQLEAVNLALAPCGISIPEPLWIADYLGRRSSDYFPAILRRFAQEASDLPDVEDLVSRKETYYQGLLHGHLDRILRPGFFDLLAFLVLRRGVKIALATSATRREVGIVMGEGGLALLPWFHHVQTCEDVTHPKPDPEVYLRLSGMAGCPPQACLVFEDSAGGVQAARSAGMRCIAVPNRWTSGQDFSQADVVLLDLLPR